MANDTLFTSGLTLDVKYCLLLKVAHFCRYLYAVSAFPLAISHRADSGIHLLRY